MRSQLEPAQTPSCPYYATLRIYCAVPVTRISTTGGIGYNGKANVGNHRHTPRVLERSRSRCEVVSTHISVVI